MRFAGFAFSDFEDNNLVIYILIYKTFVTRAEWSLPKAVASAMKGGVGSGCMIS